VGGGRRDDDVGREGLSRDGIKEEGGREGGREGVLHEALDYEGNARDVETEIFLMIILALSPGATFYLELFHPLQRNTNFSLSLSFFLFSNSGP
jgi:hypothetical protein